MTSFRTLAAMLLVLGGTAIAHADPSDVVVTAGATPPAEPTTYVQLGGVAGLDDHGFLAGGALDAGRAIGHHLWLHGRFAAGGQDDPSFSDSAPSYSGEFVQARLGVEARGCANLYACAFVGADVGVTHGQMSDRMDVVTHTDVGVFARGGLDLGSRSFRVRPELDLGFGSVTHSPTTHPTTSIGLDGGTLSLGFAYLW